MIRATPLKDNLVLDCILYSSEASSKFILKLFYSAITQDYVSLTLVAGIDPQHNPHFVAKVGLKVLIETNRNIKRREAKEYKAFLALICSKRKMLAHENKLFFCGKPLHKLGIYSTFHIYYTREVVKKTETLCRTPKYSNN